MTTEPVKVPPLSLKKRKDPGAGEGPPGQKAQRGSTQRLIQIGDQVANILQTDRKSNEVRRDPGRQLLVGRELLVGRAGGVDHQRLGVADVGQEREDLQPVDEGNRRIVSALDSEANEGAKEAALVILGRGGMVAVAGKAGVVDPRDLGVRGQEFGDLLRVFAVSLHSEVKRLQTLQELERIERRERRTQVSQPLNAGLDAEGDVAEPGEVAKDLPELQPVIARVRLGEVGESARTPVEVASVDDQTADRGAVATDELGGRVDDHVGPVLNRSNQVRRRGRVVDHQRDAVLFSDRGNFGDGEGVELGVAHGLAIKDLGLVGDGGSEGVGIARIHELHVDAELGQGVVEQVIGPAIERG